MFNRILIFILLALTIFAEGEGISLDLSKPKKSYNVEWENTTGDKSYGRLWNQTKATGILALATVGVLYALPEDFTGWDRDDIKHISQKYSYNTRTRGFVWDGDNWFFNLVGHPYVGSCYYIAARKSGFSQFYSFTYSFVMSTFFWESGFEAFAEGPSIQDTIITPGAGAVLGEYLYTVEKKIIENDGKIGNSKFFGKTALVIIDPIGSLANVMGYKDEDVMGSWTMYKADNNQNTQLAYMFKVDF